MQKQNIRNYGVTTAGPVFKDIMTYALQEFGIPPTDTPPPVMKLKIEDAPISADNAEAALQSQSGLQPPTAAR
jgi:cell division protein FtsI (penicillin-binding protein 3)